MFGLFNFLIKNKKPKKVRASSLKIGQKIQLVDPIYYLFSKKQDSTLKGEFVVLKKKKFKTDHTILNFKECGFILKHIESNAEIKIFSNRKAPFLRT